MGVRRLAPAALPPDKILGTGGWVGPTAGVDGYGKFRHNRATIPDRPARSESLYRLGYSSPQVLPKMCIKMLRVSEKHCVTQNRRLPLQ
jgi:hypothetical protein